jgi:hypothetical protein
MHRTTIMLPADLRRKADREAKSLGISLSELIRRRLSEGGGGEDIRPRFYARQPWQGPGPSDLAANHDQYLYGP